MPIDINNPGAFATTLMQALRSAIGIGTAPNDVVALDSAGRLPAVDGSQLTNLPGSLSKNFVTVIGDGTDSVFTVAHNLNTEDVAVLTLNIATGQGVTVTTAVVNANSIQLTFASPPAANNIRVEVFAL